MKRKNTEHIRLDIIMLILTLGLQTLMEIILTVNSILSADVLYLDTIFPDIANTAVSILEIGAMSVGLSIICAALFMGKKRFPYLPIYTTGIFYRRILALAMTMIVGTVSVEDILMSVSVFILDITVLTIATVLISAFANKYRRDSLENKDASALFDENALKTHVAPVYPFKKIYGKGNPLQSALLSIGILLSAVKIVSRTAGIIIAAPESILMTVGGYASDLLIVVVSYAISCLLLSVLYGENEKRKAMRVLYKED